MERTIEFSIEVNKDGNFSVRSHENESGSHYLVYDGNIYDVNDDEFTTKVGIEILSWIECWLDELEDAE